MSELQRLEFLSMVLWGFIRNGLTGSATKHYINRQFYSLSDEVKKNLYKTNPANTILYQSNEALIESSVVNTVEHYRHEEKKHGDLPLEIPDVEELRKHRVIISHPANVTFSDSTIQEFYNSDLQYKDPIAIRLWRLGEAINKKIVELGGEIKNSLNVTVQLGTIELIHGALSASLINPSELLLKDVAESVFPYFKKYEDVVKRLAAEEQTKK